ncbi:unnamed protein product [Pedinophyceae sp. YPF-701]|nr:unnamed protein product [Pedinophyceae sp. YPF-701]
MPASTILFLDVNGRIILQRDYRGDVRAQAAEKFIARLAELEDAGAATPVIEAAGLTFVYVHHSNLYIVAATRCNANAMELLSFIHSMVAVFKYYFGSLEEESLRDNFVMVYELLDEMMDFGHPQFTEAQILHEFIKTDAFRLTEKPTRPPMAVTNAVSWRSEGIRYKKNEVFLDVVEKIHMLVGAKGNVVRSEVVGALRMRTQLSGMPHCKLGLNDRLMLEAQGKSQGRKTVELEDIKFHQCVALAQYERDKTVAFVPPDGAFDLMTYRLHNPGVKPLIWLECNVERFGRSRIEYVAKLRTQFKERLQAHNVEVSLPLPPDCSAPTVRASLGQADYAPGAEALVWTIKAVPGGREAMLRCKFGLPSVRGEDESAVRRPARVKFEIPYYTVSGIQVRYLKVVEASGYQALPWVRYVTAAGDYECRMTETTPSRT